MRKELTEDGEVRHQETGREQTEQDNQPNPEPTDNYEDEYDDKEDELKRDIDDLLDQPDVITMQKTAEEIQEQGYFQNFFECPFEYQEVIFMMVKGDQESLSQSKLYLENQEIFNHYLKCIIEFSQEFDPTETLMIIASDMEKRQLIHETPDAPVSLQFIIEELWPKLGFIDPENPGVILIAEFMLNELILKNSENLNQLNLQHLKELFSGDPDEDDYEDMDMDALEQMDPEQAAAIKQHMAMEAQA